MSRSASSEILLEGGPAIRNEPVQARSTARLAALLDAAAAAIDEFGYERLTTAMVAERAGASIGTVYRYFPDRIAVLQALAARNFDRFAHRAMAALVDEKHETWVEAMDASYEVFVDAYRNEPSFRSLRVGDVIDLRPAANPQTFNSRLAMMAAEALDERFGIPRSEQLQLALEAAVEVTDALVSRAFSRDDNGDLAFLDLGRSLLHDLLVKHVDEPEE